MFVTADRAGHEHTAYEISVAGLAGPLCTVSLPAQATLLDLQKAVEVQTKVAVQCQRLYHGTLELRCDADFALLASGVAVAEVSLVVRTAEQVRWLQQLEEAECILEWMSMAPEGAKADREVVLKAISLGTRWDFRAPESALKFAAQEVREDRQVVLVAVAENARALEYAAPGLRADREVVLVALARHGHALEHVAPELKANREVVLAAVARHGTALAYAAPFLHADRELVLEAVSRTGAALQYAAEYLRADREVALTALSQAWQARAHIASEVQEDLQFDLRCIFGGILAFWCICSWLLRIQITSWVAVASILLVFIFRTAVRTPCAEVLCLGLLWCGYTSLPFLVVFSAMSIPCLLLPCILGVVGFDEEIQAMGFLCLPRWLTPSTWRRRGLWLSFLRLRSFIFHARDLESPLLAE